MDDNSVMRRYEAIATASATMVAAARIGDWDALVTAQAHCASLVQAAQLLPAVNLGARQRRTWYDIIRKVLDEDAEVRQFTEMRLAQLDEELRGFRANRDLGKVYR